MIQCDLHIHTTYSDGKNSLDDVVRYVDKNCLDLCCITDHNTLSGSIALSERGQMGSTFIFGFESRLPGLPDFLIYLPALSLSNACRLEAELTELSRLDQEVSIQVASSLGVNDALKLWQSSEHYNELGNRWLGTLQLAQLMTKSKNPSKTVISSIRQKKSAIFKDPSTCKSAQALLCISNVEWLTDVAKRYSGEIVLAHPYRELVRYASSACPMELLQFYKLLEQLFVKIKKWDLASVEHITQYSQEWWKSHFAFTPDAANEQMCRLADQYGLSLTRGSDSHCFFKGNNILSEIDPAELDKRLPKWLR